MRQLDGHISRALENKTIVRALKDGHKLILEMTNGERWGIAWATPNGVGIEGEPCLVTVNVSIVLPSVSIFGEASSL